MHLEQVVKFLNPWQAAVIIHWCKILNNYSLNWLNPFMIDLWRIYGGNIHLMASLLINKWLWIKIIAFRHTILCTWEKKWNWNTIYTVAWNFLKLSKQSYKYPLCLFPILLLRLDEKGVILWRQSEVVKNGINFVIWPICIANCRWEAEFSWRETCIPVFNRNPWWHAAQCFAGNRWFYQYRWRNLCNDW